MSDAATLLPRFEKFVFPDPNSGCWLWGGSEGTQGYGQFGVRVGGKSMPKLAHRVAWALYRGPIPDGICVLHRCDVRLCVNPDHLFLGSVPDNQRDMARKGRGTKGRWPCGVRPRGSRFAACAKSGGRSHYLGTYDTCEEASAAVAAFRAIVNKVET